MLTDVGAPLVLQHHLPLLNGGRLQFVEVVKQQRSVGIQSGRNDENVGEENLIAFIANTVDCQNHFLLVVKICVGVERTHHVGEVSVWNLNLSKLWRSSDRLRLR